MASRTDAGGWNRLELKCKTADLIGNDRRGTRRDDGFHRGYRREIEQQLVGAVKIMREGLDRLTRMGI